MQTQEEMVGENLAEQASILPICDSDGDISALRHGLNNSLSFKHIYNVNKLPNI